MLATIIFPFLALLSLASAKFSLFHNRDITPDVAAANATIYSGAHGYTYQGCYNETTGIANSAGLRALSGGNMSTGATTTPETCIDYCRTNKMTYAGLEYGQECWCATYLSGLSAKLNESVCDLACVGNATEICGGRLALTLYQATTSGAAITRVGGGAGGAGAWLYAVGAGLLGSVVLVVL